MGDQLIGADECEDAQRRGADQLKVGPGCLGLPVGGEDRLHAAESQNVVALMSMIKSAMSWLAAAASAWRIWPALAGSIRRAW